MHSDTVLRYSDPNQSLTNRRNRGVDIKYITLIVVGCFLVMTAKETECKSNKSWKDIANRFTPRINWPMVPVKIALLFLGMGK